MEVKQVLGDRHRAAGRAERVEAERLRHQRAHGRTAGAPSLRQRGRTAEERSSFQANRASRRARPRACHVELEIQEMPAVGEERRPVKSLERRRRQRRNRLTAAAGTRNRAPEWYGEQDRVVGCQVASCKAWPARRRSSAGRRRSAPRASSVRREEPSERLSGDQNGFNAPRSSSGLAAVDASGRTNSRGRTQSSPHRQCLAVRRDHRRHPEDPWNAPFAGAVTSKRTARPSPPLRRAYNTRGSLQTGSRGPPGATRGAWPLTLARTADRRDGARSGPSADAVEREGDIPRRLESKARILFETMPHIRSSGATASPPLAGKSAGSSFSTALIVSTPVGWSKGRRPTASRRAPSQG